MRHASYWSWSKVLVESALAGGAGPAELATASLSSPLVTVVVGKECAPEGCWTMSLAGSGLGEEMIEPLTDIVK